MELVKIGLQELFSCFKTTSCSCKCSDSNGVVRTEWVMSTSESIPPTIDLKEVVNSKNIDKEITETFESLDEQELMNIQVRLTLFRLCFTLTVSLIHRRCL